MSDLNGLTEPLTEREQEILACLFEGLSNRAIASRLHLAYETVKWYNTQIYSKLGVNNRDDAIARATALGLLDNQSDTAQPTGKHNLPESVTEFVGRTHEINDIIGLVATKRLITILAPGGMGKTRLSLQVAHRQIGYFADGVYFIPLAPLSSPDDIVTTIAENIGFVFHGEQSPTVQLVNFLKDRDMLLVLDNFEHLLEGTALVSDIIQSTPDVKIIVTSRERLNLRGENVYRLRGLEFPTWETPEDALEYDAVKLFMQSAKRVSSQFELQPDDLDFLARICRLTEGMPLGIELAAGWVDVHSLEQIADEIQQGIDILETELRDVPERHRSLRATFEQTWHRLTADEQTIFARLSVFRGGLTLDAAEAVADATPRHLRTLLQKSIIHSEPGNRFGIHELLRQFGADKLADTDIRLKHANYFAGFTASCQSDMKGNRELEALTRMEYDFENVRTAWWYWVEHHGWEQLSAFLFSLYWYCDARALDRIIIQMIEHARQVLQSVDPSPSVELALARLTAYSSWFYKNHMSLANVQTLCNDAIPVLERYTITEDLIFAYHCLAMIYEMEIKSQKVLDTVEVGYALAEELDDSYWQARLLLLKARILSFIDLTEASAILEQAQSILEGVQNGLVLSAVNDVRCIIMLRTGNLPLAKANILHSVQLLAPFRIPFATADDLGALGMFAVEEGDYATARDHLYQSLDIFWNAGYVIAAEEPLFGIAKLYFCEGKFEQSLEILAKLYTGLPRYSADLGELIPGASYDGLHDQLKSTMEPAHFNEIWQRGQNRTLRDIVVSLLAEMKDVAL